MRIVIGTAAALVLAGCGGGVGGNSAAGNSSGASGTATTTAPVRMQPGSWTLRMQLTRLEMQPEWHKPQFSAMLNQMRTGMQQSFDQNARNASCLTPEDVAQSNVAERIVTTGDNCTFSRRSMVGDRVDIAGVCTDRQGQRSNIAITGTGGATAQDFTVRYEPIGGNGATPKLIEARMQLQRRGECQPGDDRPFAPGAGNASAPAAATR